MVEKFKVIYSDPPWGYTDKCHAGKRGAGYKYKTMDMSDIRALNVRGLADEDGALFLWSTMPMIPEAIKVISAWGFSYKTVALTWIKRTKNWKLFWGMGSFSRANPEVCLLGVRGKPKRMSKSVHSVVEARVREHSRKPDEVRERIVELMGDVSRLEMFAREKVEGWSVWGDEVDSDVDIVPLKGADFIRFVNTRRVTSSSNDGGDGGGDV